MLCGYPPFYGESDQEVLDEAGGITMEVEANERDLKLLKRRMALFVIRSAKCFISKSVETLFSSSPSPSQFFQVRQGKVKFQAADWKLGNATFLSFETPLGCETRCFTLPTLGPRTKEERVGRRQSVVAWQW